MKRLFIVYNPRSSRFCDVKKEVLSHLPRLKGYIIGKYEVEPIGVDKNAAKFAKLLKDGDFVISAGGDATGVISANAILNSSKDVTLAVLPYGNFNDLARTLGTKTLEDIMGEQNRLFEGPPERGSARMSGARPWRRAGRTQPEKSRFAHLYPLDIIVDGKHWRYATCYVTIGMTAEAVPLFDEPKIRKNLQKGHKSSWRSYIYLVKWYFKNRRKKVFIPEFKLNGKLQPTKTSDYAAVNGRSMCRVMKGGYDYQVPQKFRSTTDRLTNFWRLFKLMAKSILVRTPGIETKGDILEFTKPSTVSLQAEGEYQTFENIKTIEVKKTNKYIKVIQK